MASTTHATISDGSKVELSFGGDYVVAVSSPYGRGESFFGRLEKRAANGDLVFLVDSSGTTRRVRPAKLLEIRVDEGVDLEDAVAGPVEEGVVSKRRDDETASAYLERLERGLGSGSYTRWIATEAGQKALADAQEEDRNGRKGATKAPRVLSAESKRAIRRTLSATKGIHDLSVRPKVLVDSYIAAVLEADDVELSDETIAAARAYALSVVEDVRAHLDGPTVEGVTPPSPKAEPDQPKTASKGRPYAERNQVWRCTECKRRTRAPFCTNGHERVDAPAGKRRDSRQEG